RTELARGEDSGNKLVMVTSAKSASSIAKGRSSSLRCTRREPDSGLSDAWRKALWKKQSASTADRDRSSLMPIREMEKVSEKWRKLREKKPIRRSHIHF